MKVLNITEELQGGFLFFLFSQGLFFKDFSENQVSHVSSTRPERAEALRPYLNHMRNFSQKYIFLKKFLLWDYYFLLADLLFYDSFHEDFADYTDFI